MRCRHWPEKHVTLWTQSRLLLKGLEHNKYCIWVHFIFELLYPLSKLMSAGLAHVLAMPYGFNPSTSFGFTHHSCCSDRRSSPAGGRVYSKYSSYSQENRQKRFQQMAEEWDFKLQLINDYWLSSTAEVCIHLSVSPWSGLTGLSPRTILAYN